MSKFKYINKKGQVSITLRLVGNEQINVGMAGYLAGNYINGFMRPAADKGGGIIYSGGQGVALTQFLRRPINKDQFYIIIAHLLEAYKMTVSINLSPDMINLDPDFITINESTGQLYLVYQPILNSQSPNQGFMRCFGQICSMLKYASPQDQAAISGFIGFASRLPGFSVNQIEQYILSVSPYTYNHVQRMPFNDPTAAPATAPDTMAEKKPSLINSTSSETVLASDDMPVPPVVPEVAPPIPEGQPLSDFSPKTDIPAAPVVPEVAPPIPEGQPLSDFSPRAESPAAPVVPEVAPVIPAESEALPPAKLTRRSNGDVFIIDKETFVIGKERARVNGCITGNNTISRVHASILNKNGGYFVIDNGSTNKTYINGSPIPAMTEMKLNSGDVIRFSNEEFDFFAPVS